MAVWPGDSQRRRLLVLYYRAGSRTLWLYGAGIQCTGSHPQIHRGEDIRMSWGEKMQAFDNKLTIIK